MAMGSLVGPIVANLYMEHFEREVLRSTSHPPRLWYRLVDDTWFIQQQAHKELLLDHISSVDPAIKFTVEGNQEDGAIPSLDTLVKPKADNSFSIKVYHKPTHTDQYLQWDSHNNLSAKYSVRGTLTHRAKVVCTSPELLNEELQHLKEALGKCKYPRWGINKVQNKIMNGNQEGRTDNNNHVGTTTQGTITTNDNSQQTDPQGEAPSVEHMVIPYVQGLGEASNTYAQNNVYRPTSRETGLSNSFWFSPRTWTQRKRKVEYHYQCQSIDCGDEYIGETSRTLGSGARNT